MRLWQINLPHSHQTQLPMNPQILVLFLKKKMTTETDNSTTTEESCVDGDDTSSYNTRMTQKPGSSVKVKPLASLKRKWNTKLEKVEKAMEKECDKRQKVKQRVISFSLTWKKNAWNLLRVEKERSWKSWASNTKR